MKRKLFQVAGSCLLSGVAPDVPFDVLDVKTSRVPCCEQAAWQ